MSASSLGLIIFKASTTCSLSCFWSKPSTSLILSFYREATQIGPLVGFVIARCTTKLRIIFLKCSSVSQAELLPCKSVLSILRKTCGCICSNPTSSMELHALAQPERPPTFLVCSQLLCYSFCYGPYCILLCKHGSC